MCGAATDVGAVVVRIALNLLYLLPGVVGGTETYAASLIDALAAADLDHEFVLFVNREAAERFPSLPANFRTEVCAVRAARRAARYAFEQGVLPLRVAAARADVVHSLGYVGPLVVGCPHVVTIHDLNFIRHGAAMPPLKRWVLGAFVRASARRADRVIAVSDFSGAELAALMGPAAARRITTVHEAGRAFAGPIDAATVEAAVAHHGLRRPYVLAFGSSSPHKNLSRLVDAFAAVAHAVPHDLVLVGHLPADVRARTRDQGGHPRVVAVGYVADSAVLPLTAGAELFAFPSLYEGFGLPVLDAQACGVAVACSSAGSLPEVAGEGALLFDPHSVDAIADAMRVALLDPALRARLREAGHRNVSRFSWARAAAETMAVYRAVAARPGGRGASSSPPAAAAL